MKKYKCSKPFYRAVYGSKESPGNAEHQTPERGDIREGIVLEQKITVRQMPDKGEKVG